MNAEKESNPKKAVQKRQAKALPLAVHEANGTYAGQPAVKKEFSGESSNAFSGNTNIPAVHGADQAYAEGSGQMFKQLEKSLEKTGDISHPETIQKEKEYKSTLNIVELREYHDNKPANAVKDNAVLVAGTNVNTTDASESPIAAAVSEVAVNPVSINTTQQEQVAEKPDTTNATDITAEAGNEIAIGDASQRGKEDEPVSYLDTAASEEALATNIAAINVMASTNATTKSASAKIKESQVAQATPQSENLGVSNSGQVERLALKNVAQKSGDTSKKSLAESVDKAIPRTKKEIKDFKENNKGAQISKALVKQVSNDVNTVRGDFGGIEKKAVPAHGKTGTPLPGPEQAKNASVNFKGALVPTIKEQALETTHYTEQAAEELTKEGITQQQLDMVDKGDLAEARIAKKQLEDNTAQLPDEAQKMHAKEHKAVDTQLKESEKTSRTSMRNDRNQLLKQTGTQQTKAKTDLEKKRDEVYKNINSRYDACKARITKKLDDLEKNSLNLFDSLQRVATNLFEITVNKRVDAFFDKRYSGWRGVGNWFSDIGVNDDDFAQVKKIFKEERNAYVTKIDGYIDMITEHSNRVVKECKDELDTTKKAIANYVKILAPELQDIGKKAQGEVNKKLLQLGREIEDRRKKLENQLVEKRKAAIAAIDKKIAAMRAKMKSTLNKIGAFLKDAAKKFFKWALESLGLDAETFMATLQKAGKAITAIFKDPGKFFSNLVTAVKGSINDFVANFKKYLTEALFDWLMGTIGSVVTLPEKWDVKGVISVILQLAGISWAFIRKKLVDIFGEEKVAYAEEKVMVVKEIVQRFLTDGVIGIWEWIKEQAENMMTTVIEGIKEWLLNKLVIGFAEWIVSLLIPGGGIMKLIQGIYKLVMWFVDNIGRIMRWVNALVNSVGNIAVGDIPAAITFIVEAMKTMIPVILDFFAKLLNISGIIDAIQRVIDRIMEPIHKAINKAVDWIKGKIKALVKKIRGGNDAGEAQQPAEENHEHLDDSEVGKVARFSADGENHKLWIDTSGSGVEIMVASTPMTVKERLAHWRDKLEKLPEKQQAHAKSLLTTADSEYDGLLGEARISDHDIKKAKEADATEAEIKEAEEQDTKVEAKENQITTTLKELFDIFGEGNELEYTIKKIAYVENGEVKLEGDYESVKAQMNKFVESLPELEKEGGNQELREELVTKGTGIRKWEIIKGAIYSPFVEDYQETLKQMKENINGEYIITTETGGSLLGDAITSDTDIKNIKIPKVKPYPDLDENGVQKRKLNGNLKFKTHKTQQPEDIVKYIHNVMKDQKDDAVTINIVETMISGSSAIGLINNKNFKSLLNSNEYPNLKIKMDLMQEKIGENVDKRRNDVINTVNTVLADDANKIEVHFHKTRYILGEDIAAQTEYDHQEPVVVFKGSNETLAAYSIIPQKGTSTRDIIIGLGNGKFNGKLQGVL